MIPYRFQTASLSVMFFVCCTRVRTVIGVQNTVIMYSVLFVTDKFWVPSERQGTSSLLPLSSEPKATFVEELEYFGIAYDSDAIITSIQHFTECPGLLALAVDHLNRLRDVMQKALKRRCAEETQEN